MHTRFILPLSTGIIWLLALGILLSSITATVLSFVPVPQLDEWQSIIYFFFRWSEGVENKLALFFDQHNEHRIATSRLIFLADCYWFECSSKLSITWIYINQFLLAFLLSYIYIKANQPHRDYNWLIIGYIFSFPFAWMHYENLTWGFQVQFVGVYFFAILALTLLALASKPEQSPNSTLYFTASLFIGFCTVYTMANGILIFPILLVYAYLVKSSATRKLIIIISAALCIAFYFYEYKSNPGHADPKEVISEHPFQLIIYAATYLGSVFKHGFNLPNWASQLAGFLYMAVFCFYLIRHFFVKPLNLFQLVFLGAAGFIFISAFATGLGRLNFGFEQAYSSRYAFPVLVGWSSLILTHTGSYLSWIIMSLILIGIINFQFRIPLFDYQSVLTRQLGLISLMVGSPDQNALKKLYPDPNFVALAAQFLEQQNLSIYPLGYQHYPGLQLEEKFKKAPTQNCFGSFDTFNMIPEVANGAKVSGWSWFSDQQTAASFIVLTDKNNRIAGLALTGALRNDVAELNKLPSNKIGWIGYVKKAPGFIKAYAVDKKRQVICPLPGHWKFSPSYLQLSQEKLYPAQEYQLKPDSTWALNAYFPSVNNLPKTKTLQQATDIWSSWNGSDVKIGTLRFGPIPSNWVDKITFTLLTGPEAKHQKINLIDKYTLELIDIVDVPISNDKWNHYNLIVSSELNLFEHSEVYIDFQDNGDQYGEWLAVALPKRVSHKDAN